MLQFGPDMVVVVPDRFVDGLVMLVVVPWKVCVVEFVKRVVPEKYQTGKLVSERGRMLTNEEYLTPDEILKTKRRIFIQRKSFWNYLFWKY
jgi:hypothetical protein